MKPRRPAHPPEPPPALPPHEDEPAGHELSEPASPSLVVKYRQLNEKYQLLVQKLGNQIAERTSAYTLGWWSMHSRQVGLALVRQGRLTASNVRWGELADAVAGTVWAPLADGLEPPGTRPSTLRELALDEARGITCCWEGPVLARRYARSDRRQVVEVMFEPRADPAGGAIVAMMARDVTARVEEEQELLRTRETLMEQERLRTIGELASGVAHDLNNTLNAIGLRLDLLRSALGPEPHRAHPHLDVIERIVDDAGAMVGRLQDFARTRRDRPLERVDLGEVVRDAAQMTYTELQEKGGMRSAPIDVRIAASDLPPVPGVASELRQVLVNLLLNARDAMPEGGHVRIRGERRPWQVILYVEDSGPGIPEAHLPRVFDPFFTTKGARGTGLGLSIAASVMARLGGLIQAGNRPEGGARFTLSFPIAAPEAEAAAAPSGAGAPQAKDGSRSSGAGAAAPGVGAAASGVGGTEAAAEPPRAARPPGGPARRVLVIDDDPDVLEATRDLLALDGVAVETAAGGAAALGRLRGGEPFDVVLCDLGMQPMNGWEVAAALHELRPALPIYLLTGWGREIAEDDPRRRLVRGILTKPVDPTRLKHLLGRSG